MFKYKSSISTSSIEGLAVLSLFIGLPLYVLWTSKHETEKERIHNYLLEQADERQRQRDRLAELSSEPDADKTSLSKCTPRLYTETPSLAALEALISRTTSSSSYPLATTIISKVPVYDCSSIDIKNSYINKRLQEEWYNVLLHGPGVLVVRHMYTDHSVLDAANQAFSTIIADEEQTDGAKGDHFAPASANERIWNSFSKHCLQDPESFVKYYSNPLLALICEAYLGPAYRITTQVNIVKPGGKPQVCHRDYHLGFQTGKEAAKWPRAMHVASQMLTLQGAIAQSDMPLQSGPTRLLPYSQLLEDGYLAYRLPEFNKLFLEKYVAVPLEKGDGLFFNPALFHAAGKNETADFDRSANLIQVSSAFGKTMETVDTVPLVGRCWTVLQKKYGAEGLSEDVMAFVHAVAEGYPFPTNLDKRPPAPGGMAPESEQQVLFTALKKRCSSQEVLDRLSLLKRDAAA